MLLLAFLFTTHHFVSEACTGISLTAADGSYFQARTIEWGGTNLNSMYVVVPRRYSQTSLTPTGENGLKFSSTGKVVPPCVESDIATILSLSVMFFTASFTE